MKTLYINGKVLTENGFMKCLLVEEGIIKKVYSENQEIKVDEVVDCEDKVLIPGFNDSHCHLFYLAEFNSQLVLNNVKSIDEIIAKGKKYIKENPHVHIVFGRGYNEEYLLERRILRKADLDKISQDIPIVITRVCGHVQTINSPAIRLLGLQATDKIAGGEIEVFEDELSGVLHENAMSFTDQLQPIYEVKTIKHMLLNEVKRANALGLTSIQSNDINVDNKSYLNILKAYQELLAEGKLDIRVTLQSTFVDVADYLAFRKLNEDNAFLKVGPLKIFLDGSLGAKSAFLRNSYKGAEGCRGISCFTRERLYSVLKRSQEEGFSVIAHAIGDAAIEQFLDVKEEVYGTANPNRLGIVHCQITGGDLINRIEALNVFIYAQPIFINSDMDVLHDSVDEQTAKTSYAFNNLYKKTMLSFGTDAPVESLNCFDNVYCAVTRFNLKHTKRLNPNEAFELKDALKAYTYHSAYMSFDEAYLGLIKEGYAADFVLLDKDIFSIDSSEIRNVNVIRTIVDGKTVFVKK